MKSASQVIRLPRRGASVRTSGARPSQTRSNRRGAAAVEFALVAPLLIMLVFGMIEYGRMLLVQQMMVNASREGARLAVVDGTSINDVKDVVESRLLGASIAVKRSDISVSPDPQSANFGVPITVSVSVPYRNISWLPSSLYLDNATLFTSTVMRREKIQ